LKSLAQTLGLLNTEFANQRAANAGLSNAQPLHSGILNTGILNTGILNTGILNAGTWNREVSNTDRVGFTGFLDDPASAMRALDIVVHASTQPEPFGLVIAEGMACGRAVIASRSGGSVEFIESGTNALT